MAVSLGYFMVILDATAVNLALPAIRQDLGGGITGLQWVIDGYTLALAALLLSAGVAGDRLGARRVFLAGLALFTAASAGCALAPAIGVLVLIRLVQERRPPSTPSSHPTHPPPPACDRGLPPPPSADCGGELAADVRGQRPGRAGRRLAHPPQGRRRGARSARGQGPARRPLGQLTAIVALTALTAGLIKAGPHGWASWPVAAGLVAAAAGGAGFVAVQRRVRSPMLPLALLRRPALSGGSVVGLLINLGFYGQLFAYSLYLQQVRGTPR